jgi:hypothetical protein
MTLFGQAVSSLRYSPITLPNILKQLPLSAKRETLQRTTNNCWVGLKECSITSIYISCGISPAHATDLGSYPLLVHQDTQKRMSSNDAYPALARAQHCTELVREALCTFPICRS